MLFALAAFGQPSYNTETRRCQKKAKMCQGKKVLR